MTTDPIGRLDRRLVLERETRITDGAGGVTLGWESVATLWAGISFSAGGELFDADRMRGGRDLTITIRHRAGLVPGMRFRDGSRGYEILSIIEVGGRRRWLSCRCEERDL